MNDTNSSIRQKYTGDTAGLQRGDWRVKSGEKCLCFERRPGQETASDNGEHQAKNARLPARGDFGCLMTFFISSNRWITTIKKNMASEFTQSDVAGVRYLFD
jgi:hypothetical protein